MFADMVGYSAVAHRDEALALRLLEELRQLVQAAVTSHHGRIVKQLGDGFLIEYACALDAVQSALDIREQLAARNQSAEPDSRVELRFGIHLGDVEHVDDDVFGNGVNIAARVQPLARPGEICLTQQVFDQARSHLTGLIVPLGKRRLKNIPVPVVVYLLPRRDLLQRRRWELRCRKLAPALVTILVLAGVTLLAATLNRPRNITVAVIPFSEPGAPAADEHSLARGLEQALCDKLTDMKQFNPRLVVLPMEIIRQARITSAHEAVSNFGVDWAVIGSLERGSNQLAVRLNLWDSRRRVAFTNNHVLTVPLAQVQGFQDRLAELTASWVGLAVPPSAAEASRAGQTQAPEAFLAYLNGLGLLGQKDRVEAVNEAIDAFRRALELDPNYAQAHAGLAEAFWAKYGITGERRLIAEARAHALKALELAPRLVKAKVALASICLGTGEADRAGLILQEALRLEPVNIEARVALGRVYEQRKEFGQAEAILRNAAARQPGWAVLVDLASFYYRVGRFAEAEGAFMSALKLTPDNALVLLDLGGLYSMRGREEEAIFRLNESLKAHPLPEAYSNLGTIYFFDGDFRRAIVMFLKAVALDDRNAALWGNLADAYRANGEREKAKATYRTAVALAVKKLAVNPVNGEMQALLGTYLAALGDKELALARARTARQLEPANPSVAFLSGLVHELADDRTGALTELQEAIRRGHPTNQVWMHPDLAALRQDPRFRPVRGDP